MTRVAKKEKMFLYHKSASSSFLYYTSDWHHSQMYLKSSIWCWTTLNAYTRLSSKQSSHELTSCLALPCLQHSNVLTNYNPINSHKSYFSFILKSYFLYILYILNESYRDIIQYAIKNMISNVKWFTLLPWNDIRPFFAVQPKYYTGRAWAKSGVNNRPCNSLCSLACHFIRAHVSAFRVLFDFRFSLFCPEEDKLFFLMLMPSCCIFDSTKCTKFSFA